MTMFTLIIMCVVTFDYIFCSESLTPYVNKHGSRLTHRAIRECHLKEFGTVPFEVYQSMPATNNTSFLEYKRFIKQIKSDRIRGHYVASENPLNTISVLEPAKPGGCHLNMRETVSQTAVQKNCIVAVNAGYFNTHNGSCLGNVVSDGEIVHDSGGIQNAHFGIKQDGRIFIGYLSHSGLRSEKFQQLVGGVVWLVRNGSNFVNVSKQLECEETEETGPMDHFVNIKSARTAVGHDNKGRVVIVQVDGKSLIDGISMWDFTELLIELGLVNAINLDGGGSATFVVNGTTVNYPSDTCRGEKNFNCDRKVSTVICIHSQDCVPADCSGHGHCNNGHCECEDGWLSPQCDRSTCTNCSGHGKCTINGCQCDAGFVGKDCNTSCPSGFYGPSCQSICNCSYGGDCDSVTGTCTCLPGFYGPLCKQTCPIGYYGTNCLTPCNCKDSCVCNPISGSCDNQSTISHKVTKCFANSSCQNADSIESAKDKRQIQIIIIVLSVISAISIATSLILAYCTCSCTCSSKRCCTKRRKSRYKSLSALVSDMPVSDSSDNDSVPMKFVDRR